MSLSPYLAFAGNCAEAIAFYQQTLGAELMFKMTFGEMPPSAQEASDGCPSGRRWRMTPSPTPACASATAS